jgi:hypothetical protein
MSTAGHSIAYSSPRSNRMVRTKKKPPEEIPGGKKRRNMGVSALYLVPSFAVLDRGLDLETHLSTEHAGNESAHGVSLPSSGFHEIGSRGAGGPVQQVEDLGCFTALADVLTALFGLGRLGAHLGLLGRSRLLDQLTFGSRHAARLCADTRAFGGSRYDSRRFSLGLRGLFRILVHFGFSLGGDDRDHIHRSESRRLQANSDAIRDCRAIALKVQGPDSIGGDRW